MALWNGTFGIGAINRLGGEVVGLNGRFCQAKGGGRFRLVEDSIQTPFMEVTFFNPEKVLDFEGNFNLTQFEDYLDHLCHKSRWQLNYVKTRSATPHNEPYSTLGEAPKGQCGEFSVI